DVRIVAATNKDLAAARTAGEFREDLFHRLNVLPLHVPALRERRTDIALMARHFLAAACAAEGKPDKQLAEPARGILEDYAWPGNVRELKNLMERAAILVDGDTVRAEDLAVWLEPAAAEEGVGLRGEIERREADAIRRALEGAEWNVTQAAAGLGIDRTNLHRKMRKYGVARRWSAVRGRGAALRNRAPEFGNGGPERGTGAVTAWGAAGGTMGGRRAGRVGAGGPKHGVCKVVP